MKNINKILNNYLEGKIPTLPVIYNDFFVEELGDMVISRHDPSTAAERRHIDGSRQGKTQVSYMVRSKTAAKALNWADNIALVLDELEINDQENGIVLACEVTAAPQFVSLDNAEQKYFETSISIDYTLNI